MEIQGTAAVVTGGASGLGAATTRELVAGGGRVAILDLPRSPGEKLAAELGDAVIFCPCDVTQEEQIKSAIEQAVQAFGSIQIDVNCAGIGWAQRTVTRDGEHPLAPFQKVVEVNLMGTFNAIRFSAERMTGNDALPSGERGVIINTASIAGLRAYKATPYTTSKAAIVGLTMSMAIDHGRDNVRVNSIAPGAVYTPMVAPLLSEELRERRKNASPLGTEGTGWDVGWAAVYLASDESRWVTGTVLTVDAGVTATVPDML